MVRYDSDEAVLNGVRKLLWSRGYRSSLGPFRITICIIVISIALDGNIAASDSLEGPLVVAGRYGCDFVSVKNESLLMSQSLITWKGKS